MGVTREKKPSKRSLKAQKGAVTTSKISPLDITTDEAGSASSGTVASSLFSNKSFFMSDHSSRASNMGFPKTANGTKLAVIAPYDTSLVTIKQTTGKGLGLFAAKRIREGTLVLAEVPTFRFTAEEEAAEAGIEQRLLEKFDELPRHLRKTYLNLHNANKTGFSKPKSIYFSNCYNLEAPRSLLGGSCLAPISSRINHSCVPNVQFSFAEEAPDGLLPALDYHIYAGDPATPNCKQGVMLFYALKDIPATKEILSNYESAYLLAADRQLKQQMYYGFTCGCHACCPESGNKHWALSDNRRQEMIVYKGQIERAEAEWDNAGRWSPPGRVNTDPKLAKELTDAAKAEAQIAIATLARITDLLIKEGLKGVELANAYKELAKWSQRAGRLDAAKSWCFQERSTCVNAFGAWSRRANEVDERLSELVKLQPFDAKDTIP